MEIKQQISGMPQIVIQVITAPGKFFAEMARTGGFLPPLVFMIAMGVVTGILQAVLGLMGLSGGMAAGMMAVILAPIVIGIFGFIGAAVLFIIWKIMGSGESYETAYRCMAYTAAIIPITVLLQQIPYLGNIAGLAWMTWLLVLASTRVHGVAAKKAWVGFGAIAVILGLTTISLEIAGRKMVKSMQNWEQENQVKMDKLEKLEKMNPEEAGKALGEFLKSFDKSNEEK
ncbi:MAG: YIP1 family protein [Desulfobulbaceae bacterium]|nr:YIP1 family protein [Desulfobulbaceae bacterium]